NPMVGLKDRYSAIELYPRVGRRPGIRTQREARFNSGTCDQHQGHQLDWTERPATDREARGSNPLWPANSGPALWTAPPHSHRNAEGSNPSGVTTTRPQHDGPCTRPRTGGLEIGGSTPPGRANTRGWPNLHNRQRRFAQNEDVRGSNPRPRTNSGV